jgi:hypothetical protein
MATQNISGGLPIEDIDAGHNAGFQSKNLADMTEEVDHSVSDRDEPHQELWNEPRVNAYRYFASLFAFTIMGMNDAAYGVSNYVSLIESPFYMLAVLLYEIQKLYRFENIGLAYLLYDITLACSRIVIKLISSISCSKSIPQSLSRW